MCLFKKLFKFKIDNRSLIDNSYSIVCKLNVRKVIGDKFKFKIYGRATPGLDIFNLNPDIVNIFIIFQDDDLDLFGKIKYKIIFELNTLEVKIISGDFEEEANFDFCFNIVYTGNEKKLYAYFFKNGSKIHDGPIAEIKNSNFSKDDQHYFGFFQSNNSEIGFFNLIEYTILKGKLYYDDPIVYINNGHFTRPDILHQKRFNKYDTSIFMPNSSLTSLYSYCDDGCAKCDPLTLKCLSCFNRYILDINSKCLGQCLFPNSYNSLLSKCESGMSNIPIAFVNDNIDPSTLTNINTNIFDRKINEALEFLIIIHLLIYINSSNQYESEITFVTSEDTFLDQNTFSNYFIKSTTTNFSLDWKINYKIIDPLDYQNINIFGKCQDSNQIFSITKNCQGICVNDCGLRFYKDLNNICQNCSSNCKTCNQNGCTECNNNFDLLYGYCMSLEFSCLNNVSNCMICYDFDEDKCKTCINDYSLLNEECISNTNCIIVDSNCTDCDLNDETICLTCINNFTLHNNICLSNTNCMIFDSNCDSCDLTDETICLTCINNFTLHNNICLSNTNCLVVDSNCCCCDIIDETKCNNCRNQYSLYQKNNICLLNSNCLIIDSNCENCNHLDETICSTCVSEYTLINGDCLSNSNCFFNITCTACNPIDETKCISCIQNYSLYYGDCLPKPNCLIAVPNCNKCNSLDETICISCMNNFELLNNSCIIENPCFLIENCIECNNLDKNLCEKCTPGKVINKNLNSCQNCKENCSECYLDPIDNNKCSKCNENFSLYNYECIKSLCFSQFCSDCSLKLTKDCHTCYECKNFDFISGLVVKCSKIIHNCKSCFFKLNSEIKCLLCEEDYVLSEDKKICEINNQVNICNKGYIYIESEEECFFISYNCKNGCEKCWGEDKNCIICNTSFQLIEMNCVKKEKKEILNLESEFFHEALKYFYFDEKSCFNVINNITLNIENNITTYLDQNNFINDKNYETKELFIDCSKNRYKCIEYNKLKYPNETFNLNSELNCDTDILQNHNYIYSIKNLKNITVSEYENICSKKKDNLIQEEKIICEDKIKCMNFTKIINSTNSTQINKCNSYYEKKETNKVSHHDKDFLKEKCEFCQKKLNYYCSWKKECKNECNFDMENKDSYLVNKNENIKINISNNLSKINIPNYITTKFNYKNQKLSFKFLKNIKKFTFELKPNQITFARNCVLKKSKKFIIKNINYKSSLKFLENIDHSKSAQTSVILTAGSLGAFPIIPSVFYEVIQFFELFNSFGILDINGGTIYNVTTNLLRDTSDFDKMLIDKNKEYEYLTFLSQSKNLLTLSILDYYLIFGIFIIYFWRLYLDKTVYSRFIRTAKLLRKLKIQKKKYYSLKYRERFIYLVKAYWLVFDPYDLLFYYEGSLFSQYIFKLPHFWYLFMNKYHLIDKKFFIFYFFLFILICLFLGNHLIINYQFLKIKSHSLFKNILIIENKEVNWYLVFYKFIFLFWNLISVFFIIIFKSFPIFCFVFIFIFLIIQTIIILCYSKKILKWYIITETISIIFFFCWILFVSIDKIFALDFPLCLNIFYILANITKLISKIIISVILRKLMKEFELQYNN